MVGLLMETSNALKILDRMTGIDPSLRELAEQARAECRREDAVLRRLEQVIQPDALVKWLITPNPVFAGGEPIDNLLSDTMMHLLYFLNAGVPS